VELIKLAGHVAGVAVKDWGVPWHDFFGVVHYDDVGLEALATLWCVIVDVTNDISLLNILGSDTTDVETDVVTWTSLW